MFLLKSSHLSFGSGFAKGILASNFFGEFMHIDLSSLFENQIPLSTLLLIENLIHEDFDRYEKNVARISVSYHDELCELEIWGMKDDLYVFTAEGATVCRALRETMNQALASFKNKFEAAPMLDLIPSLDQLLAQVDSNLLHVMKIEEYSA